MNEKREERIAYYAGKLREAEELAVQATDPESIKVWDGIVDGYRMLLSNLKSRTTNEG